jgi:cyanate permease
MGCFFLFGALGSLVSGIAYELGGWPGALAVAAVLEASALAFWCTGAGRTTARANDD